MTHRFSAWAVAAIAVAVASTTIVNTLFGQASESLQPTRVAVVDIQKVVNELEEKSAFEAEITSQAEELQQEEQQRQQKIKNLQSDLQVLSPESDAYKRTEAKVQQEAIALKAWRQFKQRQLQSEKALRVESLYRKVVSGIEQIATSSGYDLVLYKDRLRSLNADNQEQLAARIALRKVLYAREGLDITDRVIQVMNNQYNTRSDNGN